MRSNPGLGVLLAARGVSFLGDGIAVVALLVYVQQASGTATAVAALLLVADLVPALVAPVAGAVADRFPPRATLIGCESAQALLAILLSRLPDLGVMLGIVALMACLAAAAKPAARRALVGLVPSRDLVPANALFGAATHGLEAAAPLVAAVLLTVWSVGGILLVDAATFLGAAVLLTGLPTSAEQPAAEQGPPHAVTLSAGVRFIWSTPTVRAVSLGFFALVACTGVDDVALVVLSP